MKKKGPFAPEEDQIILNIIQNWDNIGVSESEDTVFGTNIDHANIGDNGGCSESKGEIQGGGANVEGNVEGKWHDEILCAINDTGS